MSTYQTDLEYFNNLAVSMAMDTLTEVVSLEAAQHRSEAIAKALFKQAGIPKSKIKYLGMEIVRDGRRFIAIGIMLDNAMVLIRASDPVTMKFYVPSTFYAVMSYMDGDEEVSHVVPIAGESPAITMNTGDPMFDDATVKAVPIPMDGSDTPVTVH